MSESGRRFGGGGSRSRSVAELTPEEARKKAKEICFDLLAARPRTKDELRQALRRKGFDERTRETLLGKLDEAGLVDDEAFAQLWVRSRHTQQGLARSALVAELKRKGVDSDVAVEAAGEIDRDAEEQRARELVRKKLRTMAGLDERTATRRLLGMLARKGYPQGLSYVVVREELRDAGAESTLLDDIVPD
ncbi:regulatory protein [Saccharomonospora amisosensis]|uniref:Regulatory protein RecX n=1 Tax=Saccharomonospora amisosensis TaxID=1128677 RepID=A0A7X5UNE3_9PSEU|nr:regulatory protein [Saccharomonospora amisosensis]